MNHILSVSAKQNVVTIYYRKICAILVVHAIKLRHVFRRVSRYICTSQYGVIRPTIADDATLKYAGSDLYMNPEGLNRTLLVYLHVLYNIIHTPRYLGLGKWY